MKSTYAIVISGRTVNEETGIMIRSVLVLFFFFRTPGIRNVGDRTIRSDQTRLLLKELLHRAGRGGLLPPPLLLIVLSECNLIFFCMSPEGFFPLHRHCRMVWLAPLAPSLPFPIPPLGMLFQRHIVQM